MSVQYFVQSVQYSPDDGRSISRNVSHLNILVHDVINLLYYEYWTDYWKMRSPNASNSIWQRRTKSFFTAFLASKNKGNCVTIIAKRNKILKYRYLCICSSITIEYGIRHKTSLRHRVLLARNIGDSLFSDWDMPNSNHI